MYRSGVKPWHSANWRPSDKQLHEREADEIRDAKEKTEVVES